MSKGSVVRRAVLVAVGGLLAWLPVAGCINPFADLGALQDILPSAAEWQQYEQDLAQFNDTVANLSAVAVRIVNDTDLVARVELTSAVEFPQLPGDETYIPDFADETTWTPIDTQTVLVAAHGTATGTLRCGTVLGLSASAPAQPGGDTYSADAGPYGLYFPEGNIALGGVGAAGEEDEEAVFSGDVLNTVRFVRPADDGLDCTTGTLVLTITAPATPTVYDPTTGDLVSAGTVGAGTVSIE
jgi:hypothetical protein